MIKDYFNRKGQGLPLNTIVIAILVILVLLFIILFFAEGMIDFGDDTEAARDCGLANPVVAQAYPDREDSDFMYIGDREEDSCSELSEYEGEEYSSVGVVRECCVRSD